MQTQSPIWCCSIAARPAASRAARTSSARSMMKPEVISRQPGAQGAISGRARSMRQDGNQLLPTRLHEILDKPVAERTGWLILLCGLAAVLLKAADHALGILLDWAIPKG